MGTSLQTQNLTAEDFGDRSTKVVMSIYTHQPEGAGAGSTENSLAVGSDVIGDRYLGAASIVLWSMTRRSGVQFQTAAQLAGKRIAEFSTPEKPP